MAESSTTSSVRRFCPVCSAHTRPTYRYCAQCGASLHDEVEKHEDNAGLLMRQVEAAVNELSNAAKRVELETLERIETKAVSWVKLQFAFFVGVLGVLVFLGYKTFEDLHQSVEETQEYISNLQQDVESRADELNQRFEGSESLIETFNKRTERFDELQNEFVEDLDQLKAQIREVRGLSQAVKDDRREIARMQNSFYRLSVHLEADSVAGANIDQLLRDLQELGYTISDKDVSLIGVDRTELIYYSDSAPPQVDELLHVLRKRYPAIKSRSIRSRRDGREILIKLEGR